MPVALLGVKLSHLCPLFGVPLLAHGLTSYLLRIASYVLATVLLDLLPLTLLPPTCYLLLATSYLLPPTSSHLLPPTGVESSHLCLDCCASPGSKTTQLLEALHASKAAAATHPHPHPHPRASKAAAANPAPALATPASPSAADGAVIANDFKPVRAFTLSKRCGNLGTACAKLAVVTHRAQVLCMWVASKARQ